LLEKQNLVK